MDIRPAYPSRRNLPSSRQGGGAIRSAASYEARFCEELRRIPFQWLKQKSILARALERVKEARPKVVFCGEALMQGPTHCAQCDMPEDRCTCERYCTICKGQLNVRLCTDGLYYCPDCREACDVSLATSRGH